MATILIVEDDANNVEILHDLLTDEGYEPIVARNRASAVEMARSEHPDLILMDMQLPGSDTDEEVNIEAGLDATREIRSDGDTSQIPVIALTAHNMFHQQERILAAGCNDLQAKPYDFDSLLSTIEQHLKSKGT